MAIDTPVAVAIEQAHARADSNETLATVLTALFTATAVLFVSFIAVMTGLS